VTLQVPDRKAFRDASERRLQLTKALFTVFGMFCVLVATEAVVRAQEGTAWKAVQVHLIFTDEALRLDKDLPPLQREDVKVKQGKNSLRVTQLISAQGENAALQLMILIDDTLNPSVGNSLNEVKEFINAQPPSAAIGVGYMSNAGVNVVQAFTANHDLAVKAVRLPRGAISTMDSPYLSLISLVKAWPQQSVRREILMISDGVDRLHGERPDPSRLGPDYSSLGHRPSYNSIHQRSNTSSVYHSMPAVSLDVTSASETSQRYNVIVYSLYAAGVGRAGRSGWDLELGLAGLTSIADETGGECFSLGTSQLVSFKPYLESLQKTLSNQYYVVFQALPRSKAGFQPIKVQTELPNSELLAPDNVWVPASSR